MGGREEVMVTRLGSSMPFTGTRLNRFRFRPVQNQARPKNVRSSSQKKKARDPSPTEMSVEPWATPKDQAAADHAHSTHSPPSQDQEQHPDKLCLDSFWSEVETIRQGSGYTDLESTRRDSRHSEEGEQEEQWLADAGLSTLINEDSEDIENVVLLSTLTRTQAEAVQRRLDSYTLTLRKKNKPPPRDVRDIFNSPITQTLLPESKHSEDCAQNSMESVAKTPLSAVMAEHQQGAPKEEFFITDVAYCEQAVIFFKQAKLPQNNIQRRKEDGTLPRVICPKCRLGVTHVQDLSHADMKKVRQLALIDMTALCDLLELEVKRHKTVKRKMPESTLFGVPLSTLLENDQKRKPNTSTPLFLQALLSFLEKKGLDSEGILRVPGSQSRVKLLQQKLEANFYSGQVSWDEVSPNDAAALLKKFIRELPAPLLTAEYLNTFSAVRDITDLKQKLHMLNLLILLLPEPNRNTLKALLEFLSKVVSREKKNRMNLWAVATIMAPNLFLHKAVPSRLTEGAEKGQAEKAADVMRLFIRYQDLLWTIPNFLMSQVRKLNENSNRRYQFYDRRIKNLLRKIHADSREKPDKNTSETCRRVKIQVGDLVSSTMEYQLNISSRASDLLAQFHCQFLRSPENGKGKTRRNGSMTYPDCALYEIGGNIGEHCLDPDTHLLDLYDNNPGGEWVIKLKPNASRGL
ncbi:rho GTPase-activating protein 40 isoform X1 [Mastacembelus armatus]|uniref:rho GTPase-activating protein 40 isoform X1 n=1 Tax=Mastacembelus armatus TaxID=205130 RepID=UPI000E45AC8E|nr:rho GTPase-activating protein 40-like isoform X1 [Mastacembelus armatus]XP_026163542.1 rho GTPase-activating protein 40-like isoform X1 [Mastacembelus armatus]